MQPISVLDFDGYVEPESPGFRSSRFGSPEAFEPRFLQKRWESGFVSPPTFDDFEDSESSARKESSKSSPEIFEGFSLSVSEQFLEHTPCKPADFEAGEGNQLAQPKRRPKGFDQPLCLKNKTLRVSQFWNRITSDTPNVFRMRTPGPDPTEFQDFSLKVVLSEGMKFL